MHFFLCLSPMLFPNPLYIYIVVRVVFFPISLLFVVSLFLFLCFILFLSFPLPFFSLYLYVLPTFTLLFYFAPIDTFDFKADVPDDRFGYCYNSGKVHEYATDTHTHTLVDLLADLLTDSNRDRPIKTIFVTFFPTIIFYLWE